MSATKLTQEEQRERAETAVCIRGATEALAQALQPRVLDNPVLRALAELFPDAIVKGFGCKDTYVHRLIVAYLGRPLPLKYPQLQFRSFLPAAVVLLDGWYYTNLTAYNQVYVIAPGIKLMTARGGLSRNTVSDFNTKSVRAATLAEVEAFLRAATRQFYSRIYPSVKARMEFARHIAEDEAY